jgi:beta-xylosidase
MRIVVLLGFVLFLSAVAFGRSPSLPEAPSGRTYTNPVFPGDHPDCTLTKVGKYYYTTGSSFSTSPTIYRSTDLVH